jgi:hypothetical protein
LAAWTGLGSTDGDGADGAIILRGLQPAIALDLEGGDLNIGHPDKPPASDFGTAAAQAFIEEQGAAGFVAEEWRDGTILPEQDHLLGGLLWIGYSFDAQGLEGRSQSENPAAQGDVLGLGTRRGQADAEEDKKSCQIPRRNPHRSWFSRSLGNLGLRSNPAF